MKKVLLTMLFGTLLAATALAAETTPSAVAKGNMTLGVTGGLTVPSGDLSNSDKANMNVGYDIGGEYDYYVSPMFAIGGEFLYGTMSNQDYSDVKAKTMQYGLVGKYIIPVGGKTVPYLRVGLAGYNRKAESPVSDNSDNVFGLNGGVGLDYRLSPAFGLGVNGVYHYAFGEFKNENDVKLLDNWNYIAFNASLSYWFGGK